MTVIEYAERRLADQSNTDHETQYWAAYLDGARVAAAENRERMEEALTKGEWRLINIEEYDKLGELAEYISLWIKSVDEYAKWLADEPPMILFWRWRKWKRTRPVWKDQKAEMKGN